MAVAGWVAVAAGLTLSPAPASAQEAGVERYIELLRSDLKTGKVAVLTEALQLTQEQGDVFWPIYREYEVELAALGDRKVALIREYAANYGSLTDEQVKSIAEQTYRLDEDVLKLQRKYYKEVEKALSPLIAARFMQVERLTTMMINLQVAAQLPLIQ
jgi:hypothetical protein